MEDANDGLAGGRRCTTLRRVVPTCAGVTDAGREGACGSKGAEQDPVVHRDGDPATQALPAAVAVADPLHVVAPDGDAVEQCRRRIQQDTHGRGAARLAPRGAPRAARQCRATHQPAATTRYFVRSPAALASARTCRIRSPPWSDRPSRPIPSSTLIVLHPSSPTRRVCVAPAAPDVTVRASYAPDGQLRGSPEGTAGTP